MLKVFCISCGSSLPDNASFCPACGAKVTAAAKPEAAPLRAMKCTSCGSSSLKKAGSGKYRCEHCGSVFFTDGKTSEEDEEAQEARVAVLLSEAQTYDDQGDYQNELQTLIKAMDLAPENDTVLLRLGRAYWRLGRPEKALEHYRTAEELYPDDPIVYVNIGTAFFQQGHYAEAKAEYEKGIAIIESAPMSACADDIAVAYGSYAFCLGKLGDRKGAKKYLSIAKRKGYSQASINTICQQLHLNRYLI